MALKLRGGLPAWQWWIGYYEDSGYLVGLGVVLEDKGRWGWLVCLVAGWAGDVLRKKTGLFPGLTGLTPPPHFWVINKVVWVLGQVYLFRFGLGVFN